ncbi:MAG: hypothetical protein U0670_00265 [Anaerolineae bacterium]
MSETSDAVTAKRPLLGTRLLRLPRITRILLAAVFAFAAALMIDRLFAASYYDVDTAGSTFSISVIFGLISYVIGWWLLLGFGPEEAKPHRLLPYYVVISTIFLIIGLALLVVGLVTAYAPS